MLDAQIAAGGGRFRGIRLGAAWDPDEAVPNHRTRPPRGLFLRDDFRAGFALLAPRGLTFEAWCYHRQIPDVTALARAFPDTTIVLDHFGGPVGVGSYAGRAREVYAEWRGHIDELATCSNVVAKLGGINMEVNGLSNFPVDAVSASYTVLWNSFKRLALFHDTAARVYRLPA